MFVGGITPKSTDWEMGGVFRTDRAIQWLLGQMAPDTQKVLAEPEGPTTAREYLTREVAIERYKWLWFLPWSELPLEATGALRKKFCEWLRDHHRDMWQFDETVSDIDVPAFHRTGWYDRLNRTTKLFEAMTDRAPSEKTRRSQRMIIGPWMHTKKVTRKQGEVDFGEDSVVDYYDQLIAWVAYWLKGVDNGVMDQPPVRLFIMGENRWRDENEWPPARAAPTDFYLHSGGNANRPSGDGSLSTAVQEKELHDTYDYDPRNPVMSIFSQRGHDEPHNLRPLDYRRDLLVYQTEPLEESVEVAGYPIVTLYASSSAVDTDFIVRLVDVHPDGFA